MRQLIKNGEWPGGSRLPTESELSQRFGASRPVVRQALAKLRDEGLISSRQGSGSYVLAEPETEALAALHFPQIRSLADIDTFLHFREGIEAEIAAVAAISRTEQDVARLRTLASAGRISRKAPLTPEEDFGFHLAVAQASRNPFYLNTVLSLQQHILMTLEMIWSFAGEGDDLPDQVRADHAAIVDFIAGGDAEGAREAMRAHLVRSRNRLQRGSMSSPPLGREPS